MSEATDPERVELEREKLRLEAEKLRVEITKLQRETSLAKSEWRKPAVLVSLASPVTAVVAVAGLIIQSRVTIRDERRASEETVARVNDQKERARLHLDEAIDLERQGKPGESMLQVHAAANVLRTPFGNFSIDAPPPDKPSNRRSRQDGE